MLAGTTSVTTVSGRRTLWEEGRTPALLVVLAVLLLAAAVVWGEVGLTGRLGLWFDVGFVLIVVAAALAVRPRDFFVVGVLPPLVLLATVVALAVVSRTAVAQASDGPVQAVVSGLAHHAGGLVTGYGLTLAVLALRQVAARNAGLIHRSAGRAPARGTTARRRPAGQAPGRRPAPRPAPARSEQAPPTRRHGQAV